MTTNVDKILVGKVDELVNNNKTSNKDVKNTKETIEVGKNNTTATTKTDEIKAKIASNDKFTPEQQVELTNMLEDAIRRAGKNADMKNLPAPRTPKGDFSYKECVKDFNTRLENWLTDQKVKATVAEEERKHGNTATVVYMNLSSKYNITTDADKELVKSLIAQAQDELPDGTVEDLAKYVGGYLDMVPDFVKNT